MPNFHATCVAINGKAVLLLGESGSGKSDLALRLIDRGAVLVADDQVILREAEGALRAFCPAPLRGLLEVRGLGILTFPWLDGVPVTLAVKAVNPAHVERLPEPAEFSCENWRIPLYSLSAFDASAPVKITLALERAIVSPRRMPGSPSAII